MAYKHRGGDYSHSLVGTSSGAPAISSNEQDRQAHLQALMQGANLGWQQAGGSAPLIVDLKQPQARSCSTACAACCAGKYSLSHSTGLAAATRRADGLDRLRGMQVVLAVEVLSTRCGALCALALLESSLFSLPKLLIKPLQLPESRY